ncbi:MAG: 3-hydroxyacyl-ACP dehydratase FabZ [Firmicutes bacterium]|nr:3-hydroxyacyl-ACP dehydratase FabZ [Bacillota bacterium]MDD4263280.1 3-hydroxyacyl-ACP dehydratase FabZ [Bacillota bacterium]MDD4693161.1 3-hydroxyacyl-ACP dehydratase FabZ [Bacillota bacterium]
MNIQEIMSILPHRYPMLLVDRVLELEPGKRVITLKNVTVNEPQFTGHYPEMPILPGVYILEIMAQSTGIAYMSSLKEAGGVPLFVGVDKARFRRQVIPGDQLIVEVNIIRAKGNVVKVHSKATVEDDLVAEADLLFALG